MSKRDSDGNVASRRGTLQLLEWLSDRYDVLAGDLMLVEVRLRAPQSPEGEWMAVVKAVHEDGQVVGFVSAPSLDVLIHLVAAKLQNGTVKWREDRPYGK